MRSENLESSMNLRDLWRFSSAAEYLKFIWLRWASKSLTSYHHFGWGERRETVKEIWSEGGSSGGGPKTLIDWTMISLELARWRQQTWTKHGNRPIFVVETTLKRSKTTKNAGALNIEHMLNDDQLFLEVISIITVTRRENIWVLNVR